MLHKNELIAIGEHIQEEIQKSKPTNGKDGINGKDGAKGFDGRDGIDGESGTGIEAKKWNGKVHLEGDIVTHNIGQYFKALSNTADEPSEASAD